MQSDCNIATTSKGNNSGPKTLGPTVNMYTDNMIPFVKNSVHRVIITYIENPGQFFVRQADQQRSFEIISKNMKDQYGSRFHSATVQTAKVGMTYVAHVAQYRSKYDLHVWARALVLEVPEPTEVWALLVDTGEYVKLHIGKLRHMIRDFTDIKAMAIRCHLSDASPRRSKWSDASVAYFKRFKGPLCEIHVDSMVYYQNLRQLSLKVQLYDISNPNNKFFINEQIIRRYGYIPGEVEAHYEAIKNEDIKELITIKDEDFKPREVGFARLQVKVCNCLSPSVIYVSLVDELIVFHEFIYYVHMFYNQTEMEGKEGWEVNEKCCVYNNKEKIWTRAAILELDKDEAKILYTDLGQIETVKVSALKLLLPELMTVRDAVVKCHLDGFKPVSGEEWPKVTTDYMNEFFNAYKQIFITKQENFSDKSMPIEIWVYDIMLCNSIEPSLLEWHCLNAKILALGMAVSDKPQELTDEDVDADAGNQTEPLFTESVLSWMQLSQVTMKAPRVRQTLDIAGSLLFLEDEKPEAAQPSNWQPPPANWLPPKPFPRQPFWGLPTHVTADGFIYLQNIQNKDQLEMISQILIENFKHPDPWAKHYDWAVGDPCIALYSDDKLFYRARVLEVNQEEFKCYVHYIDYGNEEYRSFSELRKSSVLYHIPIQATKCYLHGIEPVDKQWTSNILRSIYKLLVDGKFAVKQIGKHTEDCVSVEMRYDRNYVNDDLVRLKVAVYTKEPLQRITGNDVFYPKHNNAEYKCRIGHVTDPVIIPLTIVADNDTEKKYENIIDDIQANYERMEPLDKFYVNQPCIAYCPISQYWYRAMILECSQQDNQTRVRFVDYGYEETLYSIDLRESTEQWIALPPLTISAKMYGVKLNPIATDAAHVQAFCSVLSKGPYNVRIIKYEEEIPVVGVRNENNQSLNEILVKRSDVFLPDIEPD